MVRSIFVILVFALLILVPPGGAYGAQPSDDPETIRKELKNINKSTNWSDPASVKKASERTKQLRKQLLKLQVQRTADAPAPPPHPTAEQQEEAAKQSEITGKMLDKIQEAADKGEGALFDLAEPVRQEIEKEYEEDRDKSIKNQAYYRGLTTLVIDLSRKEAPVLINLLEKFTGIKILVLTGGANGAPVDLPMILDKAKNMPLTELHIFNFRGFLVNVPESIGAFSGLTKLSLFNNSLTKIPEAIATMKELQVLYVDINPITTLLPTVKGLTNLTELGVGKTKISAAEQEQLAKLLPNCRIVTQ
ncbi:leucine Rich repeats [Geobacter sp. OR-1]|uniref:leucine-rich repeat domain-containing protein n=1 Tax=Geobacter sp. OR-1 TaxID=1266765 RepID=UPI000544144E|nr:leucine-rich repeat domain-containing protein [Geobacter sp. OR-1]GAM08070.1 leucine Rich repeats [Geobacter sp. OR-1]